MNLMIGLIVHMAIGSLLHKQKHLAIVFITYESKALRVCTRNKIQYHVHASIFVMLCNSRKADVTCIVYM